MATATCVECDEEIEFGSRPKLGKKLICPSCGARLEVVSTNPIEVDWAYEDEEEDDDWDDEGDVNAELDSDEDWDSDFADDELDEDDAVLEDDLEAENLEEENRR